MISLTLFPVADGGAGGDHVLTKILSFCCRDQHTTPRLSDVRPQIPPPLPALPHSNEEQMKGRRPELTPHLKLGHTIGTSERHSPLKIADLTGPVGPKR